MSPFGSGFVYCDKDIIGKIEPPYASYQSVETDAVNPGLTKEFAVLNWHKNARRLESGNLNYGGLAAVGAAAKLLNRIGISNIEEHILGLEQEIRDAISELSLKTGDDSGPYRRSGIIFIDHGKKSEKAVKEILKNHRIYATVRGGYIRLGINFFNKREEITFLIKALKEII